MAEPASTCVQEILECTPLAFPTFGHKIINASSTVPGLPGYQFWTVEYLIWVMVMRNQLNHRGMELGFESDRRCATLKVADVAAGFGDDQCALELARTRSIDTKIRRQFKGDTARLAGCNRTNHH